MHRMRLGAGAACARCFGLAVGLATIVAACGGGGGGATPPGQDGGPGAKPKPPGTPAAAPACTVTSDTELGSAQAGEPAIASSGGTLAAAWTEEGSGLHVVLYDKDGKQLGTATIATASGAGEPTIAAAQDGGFLVAWPEPGTVRGVRLGADGRPVGDVSTMTQTQGGDVRATVGGNAVAWADTSGVTVADLTGMQTGNTAKVPGAREPALAGSATLRALVYATDAKIGFARLPSPMADLSPVMIGSEGLVGRAPRASVAGDGYYVTWEDDRGGTDNETVALTLVDADGKQKGEVTVPQSAGSANFPDVATVRGYAAVVYYQFRDGPPKVYLSIFGPDMKQAGEELRVSDDPARFARIAVADDTLGIVYTLRDGPAHLALLNCR